jgi:hypothetical protein
VKKYDILSGRLGLFLFCITIFKLIFGIAIPFDFAEVNTAFSALKEISGLAIDP